MNHLQYTRKLRKILKDSGLYLPKLEPQIDLTAHQLELLDRMLDDLYRDSIVVSQINSSGTEKKTLNPLLSYVQKLQVQLTGSFKALGLNFNAKADNINESKKDGADDPFTKFFSDGQ